MSRKRTVVLVGAGHAHLYVAANARELCERGARVVLVDPDEFWYSGLATGMLGGMYTSEDDRIDPRALITANGGEFLRDRVESINSGRRSMHLTSGREMAYDYLSLNVGSRVNNDLIPGMAGDSDVWPIKPISNLWRLRQTLEVRYAGGESPHLAVVGGGPTGSEIAANLHALARRCGAQPRITLLNSGERLVGQAPAGASRTLFRKLTKRGIKIETHTRVTRREPGTLVANDGRRIEADLVVLAIGLEANPLVHKLGLPTDPCDGLRINTYLHSIADARVFAAGDCAHMEGFHLPKLGVFGVKQARFIHGNILASLTGEALKNYEPQTRYLAILNLGDGTALSTWGPLWWNGHTSMWLKDWIDQRFLDGYRRASAANIH